MHIVVLIILWVARGELNLLKQTVHSQTLRMPYGETVAQCEANHQPAEARADADEIMIGHICVEIPVLPQSGA